MLSAYSKLFQGKDVCFGANLALHIHKCSACGRHWGISELGRGQCRTGKSYQLWDVSQTKLQQP